MIHSLALTILPYSAQMIAGRVVFSLGRLWLSSQHITDGVFLSLQLEQFLTTCLIFVLCQSTPSVTLSGGAGENDNCDWQIKASELELEGRIGMGSFGEVYKGYWRGTDVAVKRILEQDFTEQHMKVIQLI